MPHPTSPRPCNLSEIIDVWPDHENNCVGIAVTMGRRCRISISAASRSSASRLINRGTRLLQSGEEDIDDILEELAPLVLCKRWHQNQAAQIVRECSQKVEKFNRRQSRIAAASVSFSSFTPNRDMRQQPSGRVSTVGTSRESYTSLSSITLRQSSPQTTDAIQANTELLLSQLLQLTESLSTISSVEANAPRRRDGSSRASAEPATTRNQPTSDTLGQEIREFLEWRRTQSSTRNNSQQTSSNSGSQARTSNTTSSSTRTAAQPTNAQRPAHPRSTTETSNNQTRRQTRPTQREVTRKAIEGDCHICFLSLQDNEETSATEEPGEEGEEDEEETLVWCKNQCGYNFHKSCIDDWTDSCQRSHHAVTCPMCRAPWSMQ